MPVQWLGGFTRRYVTNRVPPRRRQLGRPHNRTVDKIVLHTTEGPTAAGAFAAYDKRAGLFSGGVHPHVTVDPFRRERYQHVPLTAASYSLKRGDADGVIQVEIVGWADHDWTTSHLDWLGTHVLGPILEAVPTIPAVAPAPFLGAAAGMLALPWPRGRARLSPSQWATVAGVLGHQHAPYDDHWDPGGIDIDRILTAVRHTGSHPDLGDTPMDQVNDTEKRRLFTVWQHNGTTHVREHTRYIATAGRAMPNVSYVIDEQVAAGRMVSVA